MKDNTSVMVIFPAETYHKINDRGRASFEFP